MPLLIMVSLHIPICGMHVLWYACNTFLSMDLFSWVTFVWEKIILYILMDILGFHQYLYLSCICILLYFAYFLSAAVAELIAITALYVCASKPLIC